MYITERKTESLTLITGYQAQFVYGGRMFCDSTTKKIELPLEIYLKQFKWPKNAYMVTIQEVIKIEEYDVCIKTKNLNSYYLPECVKDRQWCVSRDGAHSILVQNMDRNGYDYIAAYGGAYAIFGKKDVDWFLLDAPVEA